MTCYFKLATLSGGLLMTALSAAGAQRAHPSVCAEGVVVYHDIKDVPVPHDTTVIPAPAAPVRVSNPEEAAAAELALRKRAGSVGSTGVLITTVETNDGGMVTQRRKAFGIFAASDTARARQACGK